ncbi:MAG: hypothetical protein J6U56_01660, partial [Spirochaetia bacterium]|nr:hypothetical protein [Spirochaetia bacterium]
WKVAQPLITEDKAMAFIGQVDMRNPDSPQLRCDEVKEIDDLVKSQVGHSSVHLVLEEPWNSQQLNKLREFMLDHEGNCQVFLHLPLRLYDKEIIVKANHLIKVKSDFEIPEDSELKTIVSDIWTE